MKWVIAILAALLVSTNAYWAYRLVDMGVTLSYRDDDIYSNRETRKQLMTMLPDLAQDATRKEVIDAASRYTEQEPFEKDGCIWVGWLGFKFAQDDRLQSVSPSWSFGGKDPCYPAYGSP